jgi:hypothetical protein
VEKIENNPVLLLAIRTPCFSFEAAVCNAEEALAIYIETLTANGEPIHEVKLR